MKVNIGPYLNWWGPYQIAALLKYVGVKEDTYDKIGAKLAETKFNNLCEWIHSKRKRTMVVKIDKYDAWNVDSTLALIALPLLKELRVKKHGAPVSMNGFKYSSHHQYPQKCFDFYEEDDDLCDKAGFEEWETTMDKMIWSFEQLNADLEDDPESQFFVNGYTPEERKAHLEYLARVQEGLELFGKHYQSLWD